MVMKRHRKNNTDFKDKKPKTQKEMRFWMIAEITLIVIFCANLIIAKYVSNGQKETERLLLLLVLIPLILGLAIAIYILPYSIDFEIEKASKKYDKAQLCPLKNVGKRNVIQIFRKNGFRETEDGFYKKKKFTFAKDTIYYYLALVETNDLCTAAEQILARIDKIDHKKHCVCTIIFFYVPEITEKDELFVRNMSSAFLTDETVLHPKVYSTVIPILVSLNAETGKYLESRRGISVYAYGCRLLRKYFLKNPDKKHEF